MDKHKMLMQQDVVDRKTLLQVASDNPLANWCTVKLGEIVTVFDKQRIPLNEMQRQTMQGPYPYCGANGILDHINDYLFDGEYVLLAEDGGNWGAFETSAYLMRRKFWVNNHAHILKAMEGSANNSFLVYHLNYLDIKPFIGGTTRGKLNQGVMQKIPILLPPLSEQHAIAKVLRTVQESIQTRRQELELERERKAALMEYLFTHGTRNEPLKQTEIGEMPQSWSPIPLKEVVIQTQYGLSLRGESMGPYPILRMNNLEDGSISTDNLQYVSLSPESFQKFKLQAGDVLFNRTNSYDLVGKTALFDLYGDFVFASYLIRVVTDAKQLISGFLNFYLNCEYTQQRLKMLATRGVSQANISANKLVGFVIPLLSLEEQGKIMEVLRACDIKIAALEQEASLLEELFRALLEELMTGRLSTLPLIETEQVV
jgi:type I restriction enzyme S subunit